MSGEGGSGQQDRDAILANGVTPADGYGGDISCQDCWALLQADQSALLIDVRTRAEWSFVGLPDLSSVNREIGLIEWVGFPDMTANVGFADQLDALVEANGGSKDTVLMFLCRSGQRSIAAASTATGRGYKTALNILGGFEGDRDAEGHRGTVSGWKVTGLPWGQG